MKKIFFLVFSIFILNPQTTSAQNFEWELPLLDSVNWLCTTNIEEMVVEGDYIYVGFYNDCGTDFLPDKGQTPNTYIRNSIAKFDIHGNFYWSRAFNIKENWDFDVQNGTIYIMGKMLYDIEIDTQKIIKTGDEQLILLALDDTGKLLWHKRSPHFDSYMLPMAICVNKNNIVVGFDDYGRRNLIRFDSDETIPQDALYHNIIQVYDTLGNFKKYHAFNSLRHENSRSRIIDIKLKEEAFTVKLGLPSGSSFGYDTLLTYEQLKLYNPATNQLVDKLNFAAYHEFDIDYLLPVLDNRFLAVGSTIVPTIEIQERFKLNCPSNKTTCQFMSLLDHKGAVIWTQYIASKKRITDVAYDANKQEFYTSTAEGTSQAERDQTGKNRKNIITKWSPNGTIIESNIIYADNYGGILRVYNSEAFYSHTINDIDGEGFKISKLKFNENLRTQIPETIMYPNPASSHLILKGINNTALDLKLFSCNGQTVTNFTFEVKDNMSVVYLDNLRGGLYFLKVSEPNATRTFKFIKQ